jgi:uncharacterized protein YndB with AHSA1/START domain
VSEATARLELTQAPVAQTGMLIRRPAGVVFEAFVNPEITSRFWFTHGSGRLETGATVRWRWEMYGVEVDVDVKALEQDRRILIEWGTEEEPRTPVEWTFKPLSGDTTFVSIIHSGFQGTGDEQCAQACDSIGGFSLVLAGAKALLEYGIELNLVPDRFPAEMMNG